MMQELLYRASVISVTEGQRNALNQQRVSSLCNELRPAHIRRRFSVSVTRTQNTHAVAAEADVAKESTQSNAAPVPRHRLIQTRPSSTPHWSAYIVPASARYAG